MAKTAFLIGAGIFLSGCAAFDTRPTAKAEIFEPTENFYAESLLKENNVDFVVKSAFERLKKTYKPTNTRFNVLKAKAGDEFGVKLKGLLLRDGYSVFEVSDLNAFKSTNLKNLKSAIDDVETYNLTYSLDSAGSGVFYLVIKVYSLNNERVEVYNCPFLLNKNTWQKMGVWSASVFGEYLIEKQTTQEKVVDNLYGIKESF